MQSGKSQWSSSPLEAFAFCHRGVYSLKTGDYAAARNAFRKALQASAGQPENIDWLALRRNAAPGYGMPALAAAGRKETVR
ncbi:MAG: hypothetical protein GXY72_13285 [Deltaproteobacteria bacterium]|nr:hypothetical protein [Deltaproteobacteria bacterium]